VTGIQRQQRDQKSRQEAVMKCEKCGREISADQVYTHQGQTLCDDCYLEARTHPRECDPWATYLATHTRERMGQQGVEGLTDLQKTVYELIKGKGKVTRDDVIRHFNLSEAEMDAQMLPLMRLELVKEHSEGDKLYLLLIS
jgi:ribosome-binding protein aMBF1 (putative translation factor)